MATITNSQSSVNYNNVQGAKPKMHWLRPASCFVEAMSGHVESLGYQMRHSVNQLETELRETGNPHILQITLIGNDERNPYWWKLFADGNEIASGDRLFVEQCFQKSKMAFMDECKAAVEASDLMPLSNCDYELLKAAQNIANIKPYKESVI